MESSEPLVYATHDYEMPEKGFLPLKANDVLYVIERDASGWWLGKNRASAKGVFPSTYTQPFFFRYPSESIQHTLAGLRRANDFGIDLVSGVARPLAPVGAAPGHALPAAASLEELYALTNESVLQTESLRTTVRDRLAHLSSVEHAVFAASSPASHPSPSKRDSACVQGGSRDETVLQLQHTLDRIAAHREDALAAGALELPTAAWYRRYHQVLKRAPRCAALSESASAPYSPAELQLKDLQGRVAKREQVLEALAPEVKQREQQYLQEREALRRRIAVRDDLICAYLSYWASRAEQHRADYLQAKATNQCAEVNVKAEEERLEQCVRQGKETFCHLSEEYKALNTRAKALRNQLLKKTELRLLEERIQAANESIATLRQRQRSSVVQAQ